MPSDPTNAPAEEPRRLRLAEFRLHRYALPFAAPFQTATLLLHRREGWLVWARDAEGRWGVGEAAPLPGFGMESPEACLAALRAALHRLTGAPLLWPRNTGPLASVGLAEMVAAAPAAAHGVEQALLDLLAQREGVPLCRLLTAGTPASGPANDVLVNEVPVNALLGLGDPGPMAQQALGLVAQGYGTLKVKVGRDEAADLGRVAGIREAIGRQVRLRLDANGSWNEADALGRLERLAPFGIEYVEQPLPPGAPDAMARMARLSRASPIPLALDEGLHAAQDARRALELGAAQVFALKPMALGGMLAALAWARAAHAQGIAAVLTTTLDSAIGRAGALHAAAALLARRPPHVPALACGLATGDLLGADLVPHPDRPRRGVLPVPTAPGLGLGPLTPEQLPAAFHWSESL